MLLLGIDSATRAGSVGLVRAGLEPETRYLQAPGRLAEECMVLGEVSRDSGLAHGASLLSLIDECLEQAGARLEDVGGIAVSNGPGSFTGLRVALATAKGLALGGGLPIVAVPTLEALAATLLPGWGPADATPGPGAVIAACLDARKGEVYAARFVVRAPAWEDPCPRLERLSPDAACGPIDFGCELLRAVGAQPAAAAGEVPVFLIGDGAERYAAQIARPLGGRARALSPSSFHPRGAAVARLGTGIFARDGAGDGAALVPSYARASEAEIMRGRAANDDAEPRRG